MKKIKYIVLSLFAVMALNSCIENNDELTGDAKTGGALVINNQLISYVVGSGVDYEATASVLQGDAQTTSVDVYKQLTYKVYYTGADGNDSIVNKMTNKALLKTVTVNDVTSGQTANFGLTFNYTELIENLKKDDGTDVPANDGELSIGDFWTLTYVSNTSEGNAHQNAVTTKVALGTRYAGVYTVQESNYFRIGVDSGNWNGTDRIIESVNATIYRHKGVGFWDDNEFFFTVDNTTNVITVMDVDLGGAGVLLNGSPIMTCSSTDFTVLTCDDTTSVAVPDDVDGKDVLIMTVGYYTPGSGPREFFQKMVKKTD